MAFRAGRDELSRAWPTAVVALLALGACGGTPGPARSDSASDIASASPTGIASPMASPAARTPVVLTSVTGESPGPGQPALPSIDPIVGRDVLRMRLCTACRPGYR